MLNEDNYMGVLMEDIQTKLIMLAESLASVPGDVTRLKEDMIFVKSELVVIRNVLTDQSRELSGIDVRVKKLEFSRA